MKCSKCNNDHHLAVTMNALIINHGPEGPLHEIVCTKCGWTGKTDKLPKVFKKEV